MECEDLNRIGRFSYNHFNKEIEVPANYLAMSWCSSRSNI